MKRFETHAHSSYSNIRILDSINRLEDLILTSNELGLSGICLTDHECLCGAVEWLKLEKQFKESRKIPQDFKCGIGNEIYLTDSRGKQQSYYHFILIAKDTVGFHQLCELSSKSWYNSYYDRGMERVPTLKSELKEIVKKNPGHLIASSACLGGFLPKLVLQLCELEKKAVDKEQIQETRNQINSFLDYCVDLFGDDFYIEVAPGTSKDQVTFNKRVINIARAFGIKMIYGCDSHFPLKKDRYVHKAYLNSKEGEREVDSFYEFAHLMSNDEAWEYLQKSYDDKEIFDSFCRNSMEIYDKIEEYNIFHNPIIPEIQIKNYDKVERNIVGAPTLNYLSNSNNIQERYWFNECWNKLDELGLKNEKYIQRLETEADIIKTIGEKLEDCLFKYFNTIQHFIDLFWDCGSIVGPGRGSSVCFLSNMLMGITQLDPVEWDLKEWRFLNKERTELPDVDLDLSPSKRPLILKKIREERGEIRVLQVATFGTEGTKSAILAAARGYRSDEYPNGIDNDTAQYIASLIPSERGFLWSLDDVVYGNEDKNRKPISAFNNEMEKYPGLLKIIYGIDGLVNKRSQHASGVILYNDDPWMTNAIMRSPNGDLTTQFDLESAEKVGDTKFDFEK